MISKPMFTLVQLNYLVEFCEHGEHRFDCEICNEKIFKEAEEYDKSLISQDMGGKYE